MMHGNVRTKVSDTHCHLVEPVNEGSLRFSLILENANQDDEGQVVRPSGSKLGLELRYECCEVVNGVGRELGEPTEGSSLQGRGKHLARHCVVRCVKTHMGGIGIHMLVWVGCTVIPVLVEALPTVDNGASMTTLVKGCRRTESRVTVVLADLLRQDSPSISWVRTLSLVSSAGLRLEGEV